MNPPDDPARQQQREAGAEPGFARGCSSSRRRLLQHGAAAAATLGAATLLGAPARARSGPLVVWFTVEGAAAMRRIGEGFTRATGVELVVETPDDGPAKFQQAAAGGKAADAAETPEQ